MQNLLEDLKELFQQDDRLMVEDSLLKSRIIELALKLDGDLIKLLLSHPRLRQHFFADVDGVLVFDKEKFLQFVSNKAFLPDSYTAFSNKVGLSDDGGRTYLSRRRDVVLAWPYKDCVLEGGQTEEDARRDEVFWNVTLAPDDIDRLLDPKALTHFRRIDAGGEHPATEIADTDNLIVKGNNLLALHSLLPRFRGQVKLIYIDPPYNIGNGSFGYNDRFNHSTWLTFMRSRLEVAQALLRKNGSIWINIDDTEAHYLKVLADEIFGRDNFVANVVWEKSDSPRMDAEFFSSRHDHLITYAQDKACLTINRILSGEDEIPSHYNKTDDDGREYYLKPLRAMAGQDSTRSARPNLYFPLVAPDGTQVFPKLQDGTDGRWRWSKDKIDREQNRIEWIEGQKGWTPYYRIYSDQNLGRPPETIWPHSEVGSNRTSKAEINALFPASEAFSTPKPERLLQRIVHIATDPGDLVLDFFAGSGTTAAVAHKTGRQYIIVEQMDYTETIPVQRLTKVIDGEQGGISKSVDWQGGGSVVVCELMQWNARYVDQIQAAQSAEELQALWQKMQEQAFLSYRVDYAHFDEHAEEFARLSLAGQKRFLLEVLDKNQLYVNLSEIDDTDYEVSEEDKRLNRQFYGT